MVEIFSKAEFEAALPRDKRTDEPLFGHLGMRLGEHVWFWNVRPNIRIEVRSSIGKSGFSAATGENSIRLHLLSSDGTGWYATSAKAKCGSVRYITRVKGWQGRLTAQIKELFYLIKDLPPLPEGCTLQFVVKEGRNKGRPFAIRRATGDFVAFLDNK